jgi:DNA-directed RNA polymerase subunit H (RpoH/RPB5)
MSNILSDKKSLLEINQTLIENVLKMIKRRELIKDNLKIYNTIKPNSTNDTIFNFDSDVDNNKYSVYLVNTVLNSVASGSSLDDYLKANINVKKFVILKDVGKKIIKQLQEYPNVEYFTFLEMMEDVPSKHFIPEHRVLNEKEKKIVDEKFSISNLPVILTTDFMARYYNAKKGDVVKIIRLNRNSGISVIYRQVLKGNLDYVL